MNYYSNKNNNNYSFLYDDNNKSSSPPYLTFPSYTQYVNTIERNMHNPPYYTYNQEQNLPIFYNYILPAYPPIKLPEKSKINPVYQKWYTTQ